MVRQGLEPLDNSKLRWVRFRAAWVVRAITGGGNGANEHPTWQCHHHRLGTEPFLDQQ